jgi:hypothetical protein
MHLLSSERASAKGGLATLKCFEEAFFIMIVKIGSHLKPYFQKDKAKFENKDRIGRYYVGAVYIM